MSLLVSFGKIFSFNFSDVMLSSKAYNHGQQDQVGLTMKQIIHIIVTISFSLDKGTALGATGNLSFDEILYVISVHIFFLKVSTGYFPKTNSL